MRENDLSAPDPASTPVVKQVNLACGQLRLEVDQSEISLEELCGFASRRSRKRGFVFLSKVLGKHWPTRPHQMTHTHRLLATRLTSIQGPAALVGLAETATALGQGVYEQLLDLTGRDDLLYLHTTRYELDQPVALRFEESHSHATEHLLYEPVHPRARKIFQNARTLVLIDDEISTGRTLARLAAAFRQLAPHLRQVHLVCLTEWLTPELRAAVADQVHLPVSHHSLLRGSFHLESSPTFCPGDIPNVTGKGDRKDPYLPRQQGRLGILDQLRMNEETAPPVPDIPPGARVLVLGTGEFSYPPFRLASLLEARGYDVHFQSTTRSPLLSDGDISSAIETVDNYHDAIPNYLYNVADRKYDRILLCYETSPLPAAHRLPEQINAEPILFSNHPPLL